MLQSAVLRALPAIDPRLIGLQPDRRDFSRNQIFLAAEIRNPEAVDDVTRAELKRDRYPDRNVNLVCGRENIGSRWILITNFPPPLMSRDFNRKCVLVRQLSRRRMAH